MPDPNAVCADAWARGMVCDPAIRHELPYWGAALVLAALAYLAPTIVAFRRGVRLRWLVALLNLAFGLSGVGWIAALWLALAGERRR